MPWSLPALAARRMVMSPRLSPDGHLLAGTVQGDTNATSDIWVIDLDRHTERRLSYEPGHNGSATWSPDGKYVAYACEAGV